MDEQSLLKLIQEVRRDYQIPPFLKDETLKNFAIEGACLLKNLNPVCTTDDEIFRMLLKNYIYYAYHHQTNEWKANYAELILSWQLGTEVSE